MQIPRRRRDSIRHDDVAALPRLGFREAVGGAWAGSWPLYTALFLPTSALAAMYELTTPLVPWLPSVLLSIAVQYLAVGLVVFGLLGLARLATPVIPVWWMLTSWLVAAGVRGLVAGVVVEMLTDVTVNFMLRVLTWVPGTVVWIPVAVYVIAKLDRRRLILGAVTGAAEQLRAVRADTAAGDVGRHAALGVAVRDRIQPMLAEISESLDRIRGASATDDLAALARKLERTHESTLDFIAPPKAAAVAPDVMVRASWRSSFTIRPTRPVLLALLTATAAWSLFAVDVQRQFGAAGLATLSIAALTAGALQSTVPFLVDRYLPALSSRVALLPTALGTVFGMASAVLVVTAGPVPNEQWGWYAPVIFPLALFFGYVVFAAAFVLPGENAAAVRELIELRKQLDQARADDEQRQQDARARMAELLHGPVQGKLAACIMALNFRAQLVTNEEQLQELIVSIDEQVTGASQFLSELSARSAS